MSTRAEVQALITKVEELTNEVNALKAGAVPAKKNEKKAEEADAPKGLDKDPSPKLASDPAPRLDADPAPRLGESRTPRLDKAAAEEAQKKEIEAFAMKDEGMGWVSVSPAPHRNLEVVQRQTNNIPALIIPRPAPQSSPSGNPPTEDYYAVRNGVLVLATLYSEGYEEV